MSEKEENKEENKEEEINDKIKLQNYKKIISNKDKLKLKKNIILKIFHQLIINRINIVQDNYNYLDLIKIIDILNNLDKSFSCYFFNDNKSFNNISNSNSTNANNNDFYYQQEFNIIKNIYTKITKDYNITFKEPLETLNKNFVSASNKQINSNSQNKYNNNYYYIYNILYDFIILILILNKNDINNKEIKYLSPVDRIFLCENEKEQKFICKILDTYLDIKSYVNKGNKENIYQEIKSIYNVIYLYTQIYILKTKIKSNNVFNIENNEDNNNNHLNYFNNEIKSDDINYKNYNYFDLSKEDFCKIILKKDYIINQLENKIENFNRTTNNENTFRDLEEENETNKKEIEDMKKMYDLEFELMASAVYGLGINLFFNKEQQHNEQIVNNSSWITRQKDYIMELNE